MAVKRIDDQALNDLFKLNRENRRATLNKRINYKGNYENYINGGSHALDNQASIRDRNPSANTMAIADPNGIGADWTLPFIKRNIEGLNDRYVSPKTNEKQDIHRYTPSTRRGRRASDIFFNEARNGKVSKPEDLQFIQELVGKYEGRK